MANKRMFNSVVAATPSADVRNEAGGIAYSMDSKHALAQLACTGTFSNTYYASDEDQLKLVLEHAAKVPSEFLAQVAIYSRSKAHMKDMPAAMLALLAARAKTDEESRALLARSFKQVIDGPKMLRNFVQMIRSGAFGRKSFGSNVRNLIRGYFDRPAATIFRQSIGNDPSMLDIIRMVHPCPVSAEHSALYDYMGGYKARKDESEKQHKKRVDNCNRSLPEIVRHFEAWKRGDSTEVPPLDFRMLDGAKTLTPEDWTSILHSCNWTTLRMNLNTFNRHDVFKSKEAVDFAATKLADADEVRRSRVFPYQLMITYLNVSHELPKKLSLALQDAMEIAVENVPTYNGQVVVCPDVSGSMGSPITGRRAGSTSKARCIDVAALVAAAVLRKNPEAAVLPFEGRVVDIRLNPRDSVMTMAETLAGIGGGSTACSTPLIWLNQKGVKADMVIFISDNESWADYSRSAVSVHRLPAGYGPTSMASEWKKLKSRNHNAKMVLIDIQANTSTQAPDDSSVLNLGGWSDDCWNIISAFQESKGKDHWVSEIEKIEV